MDPNQAMKTAMSVNLLVFREPRGVMRIIQFVFSIMAFATTTGFTSYVEVTMSGCNPNVTRLDYAYPFRLDHVNKTVSCQNDAQVNARLIGDFSSDAQFFVATGVLSFLYCIGIVIVYILFDAKYQSEGTLPLADFILTVTLAVFWLSGSAAWANGLTGLKRATQAVLELKWCQGTPPMCQSSIYGTYSGLNISVILGFLNFFLWASDLWFLYKETPWFKLKQGAVNSAA